MRFEHFTAFRYIRYSGGNREISSSARAVIFSIAAAVIFYIASVSIMNGYLYGIMRLSFEVRSFHVISRGYHSQSEAASIVAMFKEDPDVRYAALFRETSVLLSAHHKNTVLAFFRVVPEDVFGADPGFDECIRLVDGRKSLGLNEVMISQKTAAKLRAVPGDTIFLTAMTEEDTGKLIIRKLNITGIFSSGLADLDEQLAFIGTETGDRIFEDLVPYSIMVKLHNYLKAPSFCRDYLIRGVSYLSSWEDENYNELTALRFQKNIIAFIVILVIFVAALNILSTIHITIHEKAAEIGILKSIGATPQRIMAVFVMNGVYLAFLGTIPGVVIGLFVMHNLNSIMTGSAFLLNHFFMMIYRISSLFFVSPLPEKIDFFSKDFYLDKIYTSISFEEVLFIMAVTIVFSVIAAVTPALRAGYIKPNEVLKNE